MAKPNVKALMMDKGEKYLLIGAGALMLLFAILGVSELISAPNPDDFEKEVLGTTAKVNSVIGGPVDTKSIKQLDEDFKRGIVIAPVKTNWANNLFFDPIAPPDKRRINPSVLAITDMQADFVPAKILSYDFQEDVNGNMRLGVMTVAAKKEDRLDAEKAAQISKELSGRLSGLQPVGGPRGERPQPKGKDAEAPPAAIEGGERQNVEYVPNDPEKFAGKRLALTILPQRMVIVQGSFPLRAQIDEIQKALRLESPLDVFTAYKDEEIPMFQGVLIQRQILFPDGKVETPWTDIDAITSYRETIGRRKFENKPDDISVNYVLKHKGHQLTVPMPFLISGKYPDIRMPSIKDSIARQQALRKPPPQPKSPSQFAGDFDVFDPVSPNSASAGAVGQPKLDGEQLPFQLKNNPLDKTEDPALSQAKIDEIPDHILIRLIDNDIHPGRLYQYRMKMLMRNPNWIGQIDKKKNHPYKYKQELVSRPADAEVQLLGADARNEDVIKQRFKLDADELRKNLVSDTPWTELKGTVTVPKEEYMFAEDSPVDPKGKPQIPLKQGQGILQIQKWLPVASVGTWKEPVADWVVADIVATRGTYLGGKQLVNLPIWSSQFNRFILREAPPEKGKTTPRRGVFIDPTKPGPTLVVADVEGGLRENRPLSRSSSYTEETAAEVLLLGENGSLQVRSSYADRSDAGRNERETAWKNWIEKTEKDTESLVPNTTPKKKDVFSD